MTDRLYLKRDDREFVFNTLAEAAQPENALDWELKKICFTVILLANTSRNRGEKVPEGMLEHLRAMAFDDIPRIEAGAKEAARNTLSMLCAQPSMKGN